jgi:hypothetical protein
MLEVTLITVSVFTLVSGILTLLFRLNHRKRYDFDEYDLIYHEVAVFIDDIDRGASQDQFSETTERFTDQVIEDDDGVLPKVWRIELKEFINYYSDSEEVPPKHINDVLAQLVDDMISLTEVDLSNHYTEKEQSTEIDNNPGFFGVLLDTVTSDLVSRQALIWTVFVFAVGGGLALAFFQGQGWGVLLVTIVFGGLRLYDQRRE